ncbi:hypothetical protein TNCV_4260001 [Trichonephila clavipes]|nr:hypothetical protein TNCV_4260001 [Trichonephila clavipes]
MPTQTSIPGKKHSLDAPLMPEEYVEKLQARMTEMPHLVRNGISMTSEKITYFMLNCNIRKQRRSLPYNGDSMETCQNVGDRAKLVSLLATMWIFLEIMEEIY